MQRQPELLAGTPFVRKLTLTGLVLSGAGVALTAAAAAADRDRLLPAYLMAFVFIGGIAVTGLFFSMLQYLVRAGWSVAVRRIPEFMAAFVPFLALLMIPIALGMGSLYEHWMHPAAGDAVLAGKRVWLHPTFFLLRLGAYYLVWLGLYWFIVGNSFRQDATRDTTFTERNWKFSAPGTILYGVTMTFAAFDLLMSLAPHWYSTIFGVYYFSGSLVGALAVMTILAIAIRKAGLLPEWLTPARFHDLGKLLFAFNIFWAYIAFSQYLLIWYANLPEEIVFFTARRQNGWELVSLALLIVHFVVPFVLLLSQRAKTDLNILLTGAVLLLAAHALDMFWLVMPNFSPGGVRFGWIECAPLLALSGAFVLVIGRQFRRRSAVPVNDPFLPEAAR